MMSVFAFVGDEPASSPYTYQDETGNTLTTSEDVTHQLLKPIYAFQRSEQPELLQGSKDAVKLYVNKLGDGTEERRKLKQFALQFLAEKDFQKCIALAKRVGFAKHGPPSSGKVAGGSSDAHVQTDALARVSSATTLSLIRRGEDELMALKRALLAQADKPDTDDDVLRQINLHVARIVSILEARSWPSSATAGPAHDRAIVIPGGFRCSDATRIPERARKITRSLLRHVDEAHNVAEEWGENVIKIEGNKPASAALRRHFFFCYLMARILSPTTPQAQQLPAQAPQP